MKVSQSQKSLLVLVTDLSIVFLKLACFLHHKQFYLQVELNDMDKIYTDECDKSVHGWVIGYVRKWQNVSK